MADRRGAAAVVVEAATPERWDDVCAVAGSNGFYSGCWCTWWLVASAEFDRLGHDGRRATLERLVLDGEEPGLIAYRRTFAIAS